MNPNQPSSGFSLGPREVLHILFRNKWKIIFFSLLGVGVAAYLYRTIVPPYESTAELMVKYVVDSSVTTPGAPGDGVEVRSPSDRGGDGVMNTEMEILTSWDLARSVAEKLGPDRILGPGTGTNVLAAAAQIKRSLSPVAPRRGNIMEVTYSNPRADAVAPILDAIIQRYLEVHIQVHRSLGNFDALQRETDTMRQNLRDAQNELSKLKSSLGITTIADAKKELSAQMQAAETAITETMADIAQRQARLDALQHAAASQSAGSPATNSVALLAPVDERTLEQYRLVSERLAFYRRHELELIGQFTPEHPAVKQVQEDIASAEKQKHDLEVANPALLQTALATSGKSGGPIARSGTDLSLETAELIGSQARLSTYTNQLASLKGQLVKLQESENQVTDLERRVAQLESAYTTSDSNLQRARFNAALDPNNMPNITVVQTPSAPVRDNLMRYKICGGAIAAGLALGLGLAFVRELVFDQSVRNPMEIETRMQLPMFMSIPLLSDRHPVRLLTNGSGKKSKDAEPRPERAPWEVSHFIRPYSDALRDRLIMYFQLKNIHHKPKLVAVTSCSEGAGTTTLAASLAASLSETGDGKVLLVDMNVSRPEMHPFFRGNLASSLTDLFDAGAKPSHGQYDNLYLATGTERNGTVTPLVPSKFYEMLPRMRSSDFDYIIFDMPAVKQTSATVALSGFMDKVLLLVEPGKTNRESVKRATQLMRQQHADVAGVVNRLPASAMKWLQPDLA
ncbi:P-loop NTPase [bacterium]|nr:P-loop NTPase [bacterium]